LDGQRRPINDGLVSGNIQKEERYDCTGKRSFRTIPIRKHIQFCMAKFLSYTLRNSMPKQRKKSASKTGRAASIYDVAHESGVSVFTVSAVVNKKSHVGKKLRERVEAAIGKLNYRPNLLARSLAKQKTHTIGMIVPDIANPFFPMVVRGAEDAAQKQGYNLLLCNSDDSQAKEESALELLLSKRVDGILLTKAMCDLTPPLAQMIRELKVPIVLVMRS
jgi:hypothetical protein